MLGNEELIGSLWDHEERDTCPEALVHTVHAAVGDEESSTLQELELRYKRLDDEIAGDRSQATHVCFVANRHNHAIVEVSECFAAEAVELSFVVKDGSQRNVNHRLVPQLVKRERWGLRMETYGGSDEFEGVIEGIAVDLQLCGRVDNVEFGQTRIDFGELRPGNVVRLMQLFGDRTELCQFFSYKAWLLEGLQALWDAETSVA